MDTIKILITSGKLLMSSLIVFFCSAAFGQDQIDQVVDEGVARNQDARSPRNVSIRQRMKRRRSPQDTGGS